ncbi:prophage endopeptidase tail family protein [Companilactobacillus jidongensis]|uniref:prophage endopeptidase tail family protein n=1 Tax=Companilactobacillus jidongensis TaxID=2486006 RepID=UPI000F7A7A16|nr:prophage endopeptidase tail family protein [Companilactobacillus jidongensis]
MDYKGHKLFIRSADGQNEEWLTCLDIGTFNIDKQISETFSLTFTAFQNDYDKISFDLIQKNSIVVFDGQQYVIMQVVGKIVDGFVTKDVTATHIIFGMQDFKQFKVNSGSQSYTLDQALKFVFDSDYNSEGYSYQLIGNFPTVDITDWGNCSGLDAIQKAVDSFGAKWIPDNNVVKIYDSDSYKRQTNKSFRWSHNTNDIELSIDMTSLKNGAMLYGASKDNEHSQTDGAVAIVDSAGISMTASPTGPKTRGTIVSMNGAPVYSSPTKKIKTGQVLPDGSVWKIGQQVSIDGTTWYEVETNGWVSSEYLPFDRPGDVKPENHVIDLVWGKGHIKIDGDSSSDGSDKDNGASSSIGNATLTVSTMEDGGAPVVGADMTTVVGHLPNGNTYLTTNKKTVNDVTYYLVATDQWVAEKYVTFDKDGDVKPENHVITVVSGQGTFKADNKDSSSDDSSKDNKDAAMADIYDSPFTPQVKTGSQLTAGTQYKVKASVSDGAQSKSWYQIDLGWIDQSALDFSGATDVSPTDVTNASAGAKIYDSPWTPQTILNDVLPNGTAWQINGSVSDGANGKSYYRVGVNEWVDQSNFDFSGQYDVEPSDTQGQEDGTTADDTDYVFKPFFYYNAQSRSEYGLKIGDDITNDQIKTPEQMKQYADSVLQTEPVVELTVNLSYQDDSMNIGDTSYLDAGPLGIKTMITLNGISGNPLMKDTPMTISLDNSKLSKKNINFETSDNIKLLKRNNDLLNKKVNRLSSKITGLQASQNNDKEKK